MDIWCGVHACGADGADDPRGGAGVEDLWGTVGAGLSGVFGGAASDRAADLEAEAVVKAYAFEGAWGERIRQARASELRQLRWLRYLDASITLLCSLLAQSTTVSIFSWYVLVLRRPLDRYISMLYWYPERAVMCAAPWNVSVADWRARDVRSMHGAMLGATGGWTTRVSRRTTRVTATSMTCSAMTRPPPSHGGAGRGATRRASLSPARPARARPAATSWRQL